MGHPVFSSYFLSSRQNILMKRTLLCCSITLFIGILCKRDILSDSLERRLSFCFSQIEDICMYLSAISKIFEKTILHDHSTQLKNVRTFLKGINEMKNLFFPRTGYAKSRFVCEPVYCFGKRTATSLSSLSGN